MAKWSGTGKSVTFDRVRRLRELRLIESHPAIGASTPLLWVTPRALNIIARTELRPASLNLWSVMHSIACAHVVARYESGGTPVLTERELRAEERIEGRRIYSAERKDGYARYHSPDLFVMGETRDLVEVEISLKAPDRLNAIIDAWAWWRAKNHERIDRILYLCSPETIGPVKRAMGTGNSRVVAEALDLTPDQLPRPTRPTSGGLGEPVKGRRPDPRRGLTGSPPPLPSRVSRGRGEA